EANENADSEVEHRGRCRIRHENEANGVERAARAQHAHGTEAIGDGAGKRLANTPEDILNSERQSEYVAAPPVGLRHRREKKTECGARPKADHGDETPAANDHGRLAAHE